MKSEGMILITERPPHPGEFLREDYMPECGLTVADLAKKLHVSRQSVNELVHERRSLSTDMAPRLAKLFGTTPQYWLNLQHNVDIWDSLSLEGKDLDSIDELPMASMA